MSFNDSFSHQDWKSVNVGHGGSVHRFKTKEDERIAQRQLIRSGQVSIIQRPKNLSSGINTKKIDEETETFQHKYIDAKIAKQIVAMRTEKKLTQKELAQKANIPPKDVQEIESGRALKNGKNSQNAQKLLQIMKRLPSSH